MNNGSLGTEVRWFSDNESDIGGISFECEIISLYFSGH